MVKTGQGDHRLAKFFSNLRGSELRNQTRSTLGRVRSGESAVEHTVLSFSSRENHHHESSVVPFGRSGDVFHTIKERWSCAPSFSKGPFYRLLPT
jgi:hypothetical protein